MNIAYVFDDNFAVCAAVSMISFLENNRDVKEVYFHVLDDGISENSKYKIRNMVMEYNASVEFYDVRPICDFLRKSKVETWRGKYSVYIKLLVSSVIPENVKRLIVLDADTIIVGDISELNQMSLNGHPCAMALEGICGEYQKIAGIGDTELYNTGVIVFDMDRWREEEVEKRFIKHLTTVRNNYMLPEEDPISIVLKGDVERLAPKYNFITQFYTYGSAVYFKWFSWDKLGSKFYTLEEINTCAEDVRIFHCIDLFTSRPWYENNIHPYTKMYDQYLEFTPWKVQKKPIKKMRLVEKTEYTIRKYLPRKLSDAFYAFFARWVYTVRAKKYYKI